MLVGMESKSQAYDVSDGNEDSVGYWTTGYACHILEKKKMVYLLPMS